MTRTDSFAQKSWAVIDRPYSTRTDSARDLFLCKAQCMRANATQA
jgi:hypothetical protein